LILLKNEGSDETPNQCAFRTAQCDLASPAPDDRKAFVDIFTDARVRRYLGGPLSRAHAVEKADRLIAGAHIAQCWSIRHRVDRRCIGLVELTTHHNGRDTEISYQLLPSYWGKGIAAESISVLIDYALSELKLARLVAETQSANTRSRRLLERCGMREHQTIERFGALQVIYVIDGRGEMK
jgi:ribosomal-protein-alanine N-acetyltransferase